MFCLIKAPFMFFSNKTNFMNCSRPVLPSCQSVGSGCSTPSNHSFIMSSVPVAFFEHKTTCKLDVAFGAFSPSLVLWGGHSDRCRFHSGDIPFSEQVSGAVGIRLRLIYHFSLCWFLHVLVKEMPLNSDVFNYCINHFLIL